MLGGTFYKEKGRKGLSKKVVELGVPVEHPPRGVSSASPSSSSSTPTAHPSIPTHPSNPPDSLPSHAYRRKTHTLAQQARDVKASLADSEKRMRGASTITSFRSDLD